MTENGNDVSQMTCCNMMFLSAGAGSIVYMNDIITGKPVVFCDDNRTDEELWDMFASVGMQASKYYKAGIPGSVVFIGDRTESDKYIIYDWTHNIPVLSFMSVSMFACYVSVFDGEYFFVDVLSSKRLEFESLDFDNCFKNRFRKFFDDGEYVNYVHTSGKHLILSADVKEEYDDKFLLDASRVHMFSNYEHLYTIIYNNICKM